MNNASGRITRKENPYAQVSNSALRDTNLTLKAKGLYAVINTFITIPDFILYKTHLRKQSKGGEANFDNCWNELKDHGYLVQHKYKNDKGQYFYSYELLDNSLKQVIDNDNPGGGFPGVGNRPSGKHGCISKTDLNKTDLNKTYTTTKENIVVVDTDLIKLLFQEIKDTIGASVSKKTIAQLIIEKGELEIRKYLHHWARFNNTHKSSISGFFIDAIRNSYEIPLEQMNEVKQVINSQYGKHTSFEQRQYSDEFYNSLYENGGYTNE